MKTFAALTCSSVSANEGSSPSTSASRSTSTIAPRSACRAIARSRAVKPRDIRYAASAATRSQAWRSCAGASYSSASLQAMRSSTKARTNRSPTGLLMISW